ncbi:MAG: putative DNA binding domain-containing protein [Tannerellaceae bacterium]|jgi:ATP-dependent DNA helicase RecG|nr:putative DNA binding domain-containing protein [Tannerellaceae bacterium]
MTVQELIHLRESEDRIELKEAKTQYAYNSGRKSVLGYVSAIANEGGGYLVFGIREASPHEVCGSTAFEGKEGKLEQDVYRDLQVRIKTETLFDNGKRILIIKIPSRPVGKVLYFDDVPLMRVGESLTRMSDEMYRSIIQEQEPDFSAKICEGLTFEDLDADALSVMKERYAKKQENPAFRTLPDRQILSDLELIRNNKLNYAALLLLGTRKALRQYLPNAAVTVEYRLDHSMIPYTARQEFQEPLFTAIDKIWAYINQPASNPLLHIRDKFNIYDIKSFNEDVVREAVINACVHRSYSFTDDVFIKQYPDEIVITNAGGFPSGVSKENILVINSRPRSKRLTEVLQKTGFIERSGQGVDKMFYLCLMESKPLPDFSNTDTTQVDLRLKAKIVDEAFYIFINEIQDKRQDKLNVFDLLTLDRVRQGISTDLPELSVEKLQREGLIKSQSAADKKYVLSDLYYEIAQQPAYIKEYRLRDLQIVAGCFEKANEISMRNFVEAFDNLLTREQIRYLISKMESDNLIERKGGGRSIKYNLNSNIKIDRNILEQFADKIVSV